MKKQRLLVGMAIAVVLLILVVRVEPTCVLQGLVKGESFFHGRPTTYWNREIRKSVSSKAPGVPLFPATPWTNWPRVRCIPPSHLHEMLLSHGAKEELPLLPDLLAANNAPVRR